MNYMKSLYQGRLNRRNYIIWVVAVSAVMGLFSDMFKDAQIINVLLGLASVVITVSAAVRRVHDYNKSGWFVLLLLVPIVNLIFALFLIFKKGDANKNTYGAAPDPELSLPNFLNIKK